MGWRTRSGRHRRATPLKCVTLCGAQALRSRLNICTEFHRQILRIEHGVGEKALVVVKVRIHWFLPIFGMKINRVHCTFEE